VGQVFGHHLARSSAQISYLVRPQYRNEVERGFDLVQLRIGRAPRRESLLRSRAQPRESLLRSRAQPRASTRRSPPGFRVLSSLDEVAAERFAYVLLTMSSAALRGPWLSELLARLSPDTTLISLQPDASDHALIRGSGIRPEQLVYGSIGFVAFAAPLPGQRGVPAASTCYWFPPLSKSAFSGAHERAAAFVGLLRRGHRFPAALAPDVARAMAFPNAVGMTYLTALEAADWSLTKLREGALLRVCERAVREVLAVVQHQHGRAPFGLGLLAHGWLAAFGFGLAARVTPFPLLAFVAQHFTKVAAQTQLIVAQLVVEAERTGLPHEALAQLLANAQARASSAGEQPGPP
jgi:ketopantoate reductase